MKASIIARGTPGFSGADLANLVNEAALFAARENRRTVDMDHFERAKDKIMMGAERKSMVMSERDKKLTAYHEAGHAIVGLLVPSHDPVYKVTIIPRGRALGVTMFLPEEDRYSYTKEQLDSQISSLFGGRLAEELIFGADFVTTGASNDIQRATEIARNMVTRWGLSGPPRPAQVQRGRGRGLSRPYGDPAQADVGRDRPRHRRGGCGTSSIATTSARRGSWRRTWNASTRWRMRSSSTRRSTPSRSRTSWPGRTPRPPEDWDDDVSPGGSDAVDPGEDRLRTPRGGPIGGPASEH